MHPHTTFTTACSLHVDGPQWRIVRVRAEVSKYDGHIIVHAIHPLDGEQVISDKDHSIIYDKVVAAANLLDITDDFVGQLDPYTVTYLSATGQTPT